MAKAVAFLADGTVKAGVICPGPGRFLGLSFGNTNAAACYVRIYNMAGPPSTDAIPVLRYLIPGNSTGAGREKPASSAGVEFSAGIAYRVTTGAGDTDNTAAAANEVMGNFEYAAPTSTS